MVLWPESECQPSSPPNKILFLQNAHICEADACLFLTWPRFHQMAPAGTCTLQRFGVASAVCASCNTRESSKLSRSIHELLYPDASSKTHSNPPVWLRDELRGPRR